MSSKKSTPNKSSLSQQSPSQSPFSVDSRSSIKPVPMTVEEDEIAEELSTEFGQQINELESLLNPFFQLSSEDLHRKLTQQELAQLDIIRAYCINTLFYSNSVLFFLWIILFLLSLSFFFLVLIVHVVFLKTQGVSTTDHPVKEELVIFSCSFFLLSFFLFIFFFVVRCF
jgi:hypothetical protein